MAGGAVRAFESQVTVVRPLVVRALRIWFKFRWVLVASECLLARPLVINCPSHGLGLMTMEFGMGCVGVQFRMGRGIFFVLIWFFGWISISVASYLMNKWLGVWADGARLIGVSAAGAARGPDVL